MRNTAKVNLSLLSKQLWRILCAPPSSLLVETLKAKYIDLSTASLIRKPYNSSWIWKGITHDSTLITSNLRWKIGSGNQIPLNHPLWWPMQSRSIPSDSLSTVNDLILHTNKAWKPKKWNVALIHDLYSPFHAHEILASPISFTLSEDLIAWSGNTSSTYTAKDGFSLLSHSPPLHPDPFWKFLWTIKLPPKYQLFTWKLLQRALPAGDILNHHHLRCSL